MNKSKAAWKLSLVAILLILLSIVFYFNDGQKYKASYTDKDDGLLTLHFQNGSSRTFVDRKGESSSDNISYKLSHYFAEEGFFAIHETYYEGYGGLVVSAKDGTEYETFCGTPVFSKDGQWMVTYCMDIAAGFSKNGLEIWKVKDGILEKSFSVEPDWGPENVKWAEDNIVTFHKMAWKDNEVVNSGLGRLSLVNWKWQLE